MQNYELKRINCITNDYTTKINTISWVKQPKTIKKLWLKVLIELYI